MADTLMVDGKKYFEEGYLKLANNNTKRAKQRIAELEKQLAALQWQPITPENLPKVGDEVLSVKHNDSTKLIICGGNHDFDWWCVEMRYAHFRPINPPTQDKPDEVHFTFWDAIYAFWHGFTHPFQTKEDVLKWAQEQTDKKFRKAAGAPPMHN